MWSGTIIKEGIGHCLAMPMLIDPRKLARDPLNQGVEEELGDFFGGRSITIT
jgi:hypothetical protein